ncbi:LOW QUALITY PROTEIN: NB-ARC domain containing protein [Trema orientale]|uniref:NB-ARC domain containing protein n=1 Tax=Trema orientale TaxID=63057 RepID=A0A2P5B8V1_TREOI|nr:LOW QUALITY PROTEIN: NB-ARC domain containing protein [Trema orientale]
MAEPVVSFVLHRIGDLLINEVKFLSGVKTQVEEARKELEFMLCFLKDADACAKDGSCQRMCKWVAEIRDCAYDLEDAIENFALKLAYERSNTLPMKYLLKTRLACTWYKGIERKNKFLERQKELRRSYSHVVECDVVGFEEDIKKLVVHLTEEGNLHRVVSICGMGGLGKTTLARNVYHQSEVRRHFSNFAWASISQHCEVRDVWEGILIKLISPSMWERNEIRTMMDDEIAKKLYSVQKEMKCLVVLDDLWTTETWDRLKAAFPEADTDSKILVTTRKKDVALYVDRNGILHEPRCLDKNESWELFKKKACFGKRMTGNASLSVCFWSQRRY